MSDLATKEVLTTGDVARLCHVAPRTVSKWVDSGKLRGYRVPGSGSRRIPVGQLVAFMRAHGFPLDGLDAGVRRILLVGAGFDPALARAMASTDRYDVRTAATWFSAGMIAQELRPHVLVLDVDGDPAEARAVCRTVQASPHLRAARTVAAAQSPTEDARWQRDGFDACLRKPIEPGELARLVDRLAEADP